MRYVALSIFASLSVIAGLVVLVAHRPLPQYQQPGQTGAGWKSIAPEDQSEVPTGGKPLAIERFVPKAQQGIDPAQVTTTVEIKTDPNIPAFIPDSISVKKGEIIKLIFKNTSRMDHYDNFVLVHPRMEEYVAEEGFQVGPEGGYIPILPNEIIAHTKTIPPGDTEIIIFRAPAEPGKYPYISTLPRRWKAMHGVLEVK